MSDAAISAQRGTTIKWRLDATIPDTGQPWDFTTSGQTVTLTIRRRPGDTVPLIQKTYTSAAPTAEPALTVPAGAGNQHYLDVTLAPADTTPFAQTEFLVWDAILTDNANVKTAIAKGALTVRAGAGS